MTTFNLPLNFNPYDTRTISSLKCGTFLAQYHNFCERFSIESFTHVGYGGGGKGYSAAGYGPAGTQIAHLLSLQLSLLHLLRSTMVLCDYNDSQELDDD